MKEYTAQESREYWIKEAEELAKMLNPETQPEELLKIQAKINKLKAIKD